MKKTLFVTWIMLIAFPVFPQNSNIPDGWNFGGSYSDFKPGLDTLISKHGKNSATLESISENPANFCTLMQYIIVKDFAGKRIRMTGYIKSKGTDEIGTMWVRIDDFGNKEFGDFDNMMDRPVTGTGDWKECEIIFDVPEKCMINFGFIFQGTGKVWVDNVSFEIVDKSVSKTASPLGQTFPDEYIQQLKDYPNGFPEKPALNLDFEESHSSIPVVDLSTDLPKNDLHVHLTSNYAANPAQRYEKAMAVSQKMGITFGIAEEYEYPDINANDRYLTECIGLSRKYHLYVGLQVSGPGWNKLYSKKVRDSLDYIMEDALRLPDKNGRSQAIWLPGYVVDNAEEFMDRYVAHNLKVLSDPIKIWANPTFLPINLQSRYEELWTEIRMKTLIDAAVKNNIAIEINSRFMIPDKKFIMMAKAAGAHFTFGSNQHDVNFGDINWSIKMAKECGLKPGDFFVPKRKLPEKK